MAAILRVLSVPEAVIVESFLLSDKDGVRAARIRQALAGIGDPAVALRRLDLAQFRRRLLTPA